MTARTHSVAAFQLNRTRADGAPEVSVVTPMHDEAENVAPLIAEIVAALVEFEFEIIAVDDRSGDDTLGALRLVQESVPELRIFAHARQAGQSRALRTGVLAARAPVVVTIDGDGQNDPADIPTLVKALSDPQAGPDIALVGGRRRKRQDSVPKRLAASFANGVRKRILKDGADDTGCGLKAFYRDAYLRLPYFDHMHRYIPALMRREGLEVRFVDVAHRPRLHGASNYSNWQRLAVAFRDLLGVIWLNSRAKSPEAVTELPPSKTVSEEARAFEKNYVKLRANQ